MATKQILSKNPLLKIFKAQKWTLSREGFRLGWSEATFLFFEPRVKMFLYRRRYVFQPNRKERVLHCRQSGPHPPLRQASKEHRECTPKMRNIEFWYKKRKIRYTVCWRPGISHSIIITTMDWMAMNAVNEVSHRIIGPCMNFCHCFWVVEICRRPWIGAIKVCMASLFLLCAAEKLILIWTAYAI